MLFSSFFSFSVNSFVLVVSEAFSVEEGGRGSVKGSTGIQGIPDLPAAEVPVISDEGGGHRLDECFVCIALDLGAPMISGTYCDSAPEDL